MESSSCMVSFSDVQASPETKQIVDQQAKACDDGQGAALAAATIGQHDGKTPVPDDHQQEASAPEHDAAAEAPPAPQEHGDDDEKDQQAVATKEEVEPPEAASASAAADDDHHQAQEESTRERLKRHRREMAGRVWVPEMWGQEKLLKDWVDCAVFDRPMVPTGLLTARRALIAECCTTTRRPAADRRTAPSPSSATTSSSPTLRVRNGCS